MTNQALVNGPLLNGPWIVAQLTRVRTLEHEVSDLFKRGASQAELRSRVTHLQSQLALLDLALD